MKTEMIKRSGLKLGVLGLAVVLALATTGCTRSLTANGLGGSMVTRVDSNELPGPNGQTGEDQGYVFRLGPFDKLIVDVLAIPELTGRKITVDGSGNIALPVGGIVHVGGMTLGEATRAVDDRMRQSHVLNPQVALNLEQSVSAFLTVDGAVKSPGNYPVLSGMTLMRAVAEAKGESEFAKTSEVVIRRNVRGQEMIALYDLNAIRAGNYSDPQLYPGDFVTVGESPGRRLLQQIITASPLFVTPIVAAFRSSSF